MEGETIGPKRFFGTPKPVAVGDVVELTMESQGARGDGIAKKDNFVIFVKGAAKGETCKVKITELKRTFANGEKA
jgi:23S rRNA (uracil1939-C5)-methyltransferase